MRGRPPKATALKLITGNPGRRPLNTDEPDFRGEVRKPSWVKYKAAKYWKQHAPELIRLGILKSTDVVAFAAFCVLSAELEESPKNFTSARHAQLRAYMNMFGLDPSSRSRFSVDKGEKKDGAEKFFD